MATIATITRKLGPPERLAGSPPTVGGLLRVTGRGFCSRYNGDPHRGQTSPSADSSQRKQWPAIPQANRSSRGGCRPLRPPTLPGRYPS